MKKDIQKEIIKKIIEKTPILPTAVKKVLLNNIDIFSEKKLLTIIDVIEKNEIKLINKLEEKQKKDYWKQVKNLLQEREENKKIHKKEQEQAEKKLLSLLD